jgi:hypothetical protein
MSDDDRRRIAVIHEAKTPFEAEAIAAALRGRGFNAQVVDDAAARAWGMTIGTIASPKVAVLEAEAVAARAALADIEATSPSIDWDAQDLGSAAEPHRLLQANRARRWMLTLVAILTPAGLFVLSYGVDRADPTLKTIGGVLLATAAVILVNLLVEGARARRDEGEGQM